MPLDDVEGEVRGLQEVIDSRRRQASPDQANEIEVGAHRASDGFPAQHLLDLCDRAHLQPYKMPVLKPAFCNLSPQPFPRKRAYSLP